MQRDGFAPLNDLFDTEAIRQLFASREDISRISSGDGGNAKSRREMGMAEDRETVAIGEAHVHIEASGVAANILPVSDDLMTLMDGETLTAAKSIAHDGIARAGRIRVHFYESDLEGRPSEMTPSAGRTSEVIVLASGGKCVRYGMARYRASDGVILTPGLEGMVPTHRILRARRLPITPYCGRPYRKDRDRQVRLYWE